MRTVLITGCSSGIGRATALAFLAEEWRVYATARDPRDISDLADAGCETATLDVTDGEQVEGVVRRIVEETGRIDCLVNNAGYGQFGPLEALSVEELRRQFDVNVHGVHRLIRAVLPHMRERGDGTIINISSNLGRVAVPGGGAYCGSKFAVEAMSDALRAETERFGVDVVVVEPGSVSTNFHDRADEELQRELDGAYRWLYRLFDDVMAITRDGPLTVTPDDVADAIVNAASSTAPAARYSVGPIARWSNLVRLLPDRWRDAGYRWVARLVG